mmetsp:Transcript_661/g.2328  ORF Transcript_661/g.2328 Transcript_661/m.2328 type:complete len:576 (+) Transcript_661:41-1768(+)|eukprot:CAMPEP_0175235992 /NCGR_PEP_ID=MMETSP0093-20121207/27774_1 /TAXON_ID=311494 /ORGANISM="Alexandrium monilatum, Strain CCMP3105" /LENGTH=575 /DNA_ID=CAMNT_0016529925 /DNA_START=38 /DNA_END=1765 /DNA_ORIENTATION=+
MTTFQAASQLAAAQQLLLREDPKAALEARKRAEAALATYSEKGDKDGELEAMQQLITADLAGKQPLEAIRMAKDKLFFFQTEGNKKGEAAMLLALAQAQLVAKEPRPALDSAKRAVAAFHKLGDVKGEFRAMQKVMVEAYIMLGDKKEALQTASLALNLSKRLPDDSAKADAFFAVMQARAASESRDALAAANEALMLYKKVRDEKGQAMTYSAMAEVYLSKREPSGALGPAEDALELFRDMGNTKGTVEALELMVKALVQSGQAADALVACQEQMQTFKQARDYQGQASTYVTLFLAHRSQEDQDAHANEALELAGDALDLFRQLGDRKGEADIWTLIAETHLAYGMQEEAMQEAQEALMICRDLKDKKGQDKANIVLTEVYIRRGEPALAPLHGEGLELLGHIASAIDERDGSAYQAANERLMAIGGFGLLTETEQAAALTPVMSKDPDAAIEFMNANAPEGSEEEAGRAATGPQSVGTVPKPMTYMGFRYSGISYGPRFRCIDSGAAFKKAATVQDGDTIGCAVLQVQDMSDDWECALKLHPAILDCALQSTSNCGYLLAPREKADSKGKKK